MRGLQDRHVPSQAHQRYPLWEVSILECLRLIQVPFYQVAQEVDVDAGKKLACKISQRCVATKELRPSNSSLISIWLNPL